MEAISISEGRRRLFELRERAVSDHEEIVLTHKDGNVVLVSLEEWERCRETLRFVKDKEALLALADTLKKSRGVPFEKVFEDLK